VAVVGLTVIKYATDMRFRGRRTRLSGAAVWVDGRHWNRLVVPLLLSTVERV